MFTQTTGTANQAIKDNAMRWHASKTEAADEGLPTNSLTMDVLPTDLYSTNFTFDAPDSSALSASSTLNGTLERSDSFSPTTINHNTPSPPSNPASSAAPLNPRSCTTCRRRKVRCDKRHPCSNCSKAGIECVFPGPGRAPRRTKKPPDTELLARLRRLEGVVRSLGKGADGEELTLDGAEPTEEKGGDQQPAPAVPNSPAAGGDEEAPQMVLGKGADGKDHMMCAPSKWIRRWPTHEPSEKRPKNLEQEFGRLVVDEGRSKYVSNRLFNSLTDEVTEMREILDVDSEEEEDYPSPISNSTASSNHQNFIFSFSSSMRTLRNLHPSPALIALIWRLFKENVDPLVRMLHKDSFEPQLKEAVQNLDQVAKPMEALMFAIYYAVVISLSVEECRTLLNEDKDTALKKFRFAIEQALARAGFLNTQDLLTMQAFILFLVCLRRHDDPGLVWSLTGLAIRIALSLGLHRDGTQFGLPPFETEMRRRMWWQVATLDARASEDQGTEPTINERNFDTRMPLNIDDQDIWPGIEETPEEHQGLSEMSFDIVRYRVTTTVRRLTFLTPGGIPCPFPRPMATVEDLDSIVEELRKTLEEKYLQHCDMKIPIQYVMVTVCRIILDKMWLIIHHPLERGDLKQTLPQETKEKAFKVCIEIAEASHAVQTNPVAKKWGWLFRTYIQWHALALLVLELCSRTQGPDVERAWKIVDTVFPDWTSTEYNTKRGMLWKPLQKLMTRAKAARARELERAARFPTDGSLGPAVSIATAPMQGIDPLTNLTNVDFMGSIPNDGNFGTNASDPGMQQFLSTQPPLYSEEGMNQWVFDDSALTQDPLKGDDLMNWSGWDDMVRDFQLEVGREEGMDKNMLGNTSGWW